VAKRILIVDDNRDWVQLLAIRFKAEGYKIDAAFDAMYAMTKIREVQPDLLLLDINMPAGGGISVLKNLRMNVNTFDTPVIIMTGRVDPGVKRVVEKHGISGYFLKPADMNELIKKIKEIFGENKADAADKKEDDDKAD
jgi:DNA-binding response OmpR family regulator